LFIYLVESKASATKSIKISPTLNKNENIVKLKQIIELSQKYSKVRVFMVAKVVQKEEALQRL
jgi:translation initiation factor IF-3